MTPGLDRIPDGFGGIGPSARRRCANPAAPYLAGASAIAAPASALAITASALSTAALSSSLRHVSTEWPSSNDRSSTPRVRETSSRSAAMASESSLASAPFREDRVTCLSLLHRDHGPSGSVLTTDDYCMIGALLVHRIPACCVAGIAAGPLACRECEKGWQDKGPRCAARSVGCFLYGICLALRCARAISDVHARCFLKICNGNRTSRAQAYES